MVFNKCDLPHEQIIMEPGTENIELSARTGQGMNQLLKAIEDKLFSGRIKAKLLIPFSRGEVTSYLCEEADVSVMDYRPEGTYFELSLKEADYQRFKEYEII